jgi:hypothetical protein
VVSGVAVRLPRSARAEHRQRVDQGTLEHAEKSGAPNQALITFSFNTVSQGLYICHGLLPRFPIYSVGIAREQLIGRVRGPQFDVTPLEEDASTLRRLAQADARVVGYPGKSIIAT